MTLKDFEHKAFDIMGTQFMQVQNSAEDLFVYRGILDVVQRDHLEVDVTIVRRCSTRQQGIQFGRFKLNGLKAFFLQVIKQLGVFNDAFSLGKVIQVEFAVIAKELVRITGNFA